MKKKGKKKMKGFTLDVCASADAGWDVYEGPSEDRPEISVFTYQNVGEPPVVSLDRRGCGVFVIDLETARVLSEALATLLKRLE